MAAPACMLKTYLWMKCWWVVNGWIWAHLCHLWPFPTLYKSLHPSAITDHTPLHSSGSKVCSCHWNHNWTERRKESQFAMVNFQLTPGLMEQDAKQVVSHFSSMSSNKPKLGAISSPVISAGLVLFYQPPSGASQNVLSAETEVFWKLSG